MPGLPLEDALRVTQQTLAKYIGRKGSKYKLVNEVADRTIGITAALFKHTKTTWDGGPTWQFPLQFNRAQVAEWAGVGQKIEFKATKAVTWGSVPRRFLRWGWYVDWAEVDSQSDPETLLISILEQAREDAHLAIIQLIHDAFNSPDGNYLHDGTPDYLAMFGWRHWFTIDGKHITGDTSKSVGAINPHDQSLWRNPYISPVAASDGRGKLKSVHQLRKALERAFRMLDYQGVGGYGALGAPVRGLHEDDPDRRKSLKESPYKIMCDTGTYDDYRDVVFDRRDNVGEDQAMLPSVYKGCTVMENERMGIDPTYGYGFDSAGNALWADRTGDYASGQWKGYGETLVLNCEFAHMLVHGDHDPKIYEPYRPQGLAGIGYEGDMWLQLGCRSRRRGGVYLGPYELLDAA